jgi:hypothetical protein
MDLDPLRKDRFHTMILSAVRMIMADTSFFELMNVFTALTTITPFEMTPHFGERDLLDRMRLSQKLKDYHLGQSHDMILRKNSSYDIIIIH